MKNNVVRAKKIKQIQIYRDFNFLQKIYMGQVRNKILSIPNWVKMYDIVNRSRFFLAGWGNQSGKSVRLINVFILNPFKKLFFLCQVRNKSKVIFKIAIIIKIGFLSSFHFDEQIN